MTTTNACARCGAPGFAEDRFCGSCGAPRTPAPVPAVASNQTGETSAYGARLLAMVRKATVGEYEIRGEIGRGGMAAVYLAYDLRLNRKVAVKVMLPELALHEGMEDRFRREARTAAKLDHPNIVVIYSVRDDGDLLYFVMKFIEGASLEQLVRKYAPLPLPIAQYVLVQLANALQYAHDEGVVHRDVKPANVLLDRRGNTLVTDFGIAKATESPTLTRTGSVIGTPAYMSPEQCMGHEQTHASDQYALGVVAYELVAGRPPFVGPSVELQWAHVKTQPPPLLDFRPDCPPALADAIMRMLEKDPAARWPSLQDVLPTIATGLVPGDESPRARLAELVRVVAPVRTDAIAITPASPIPRGRGATPAAPVTPVTPITSITIAPPQAQLEVGDSMQLSVVPQPTPAPGLQLPMPTWTSSAPAIVAISPEGVVNAIAPGSAIITAQAGSAAASTTVAVRPAAVTTVRLQPLRGPLEVGASAQMTCVIRDARDRDITGREVDWASSNPRVASVASTGEVTAHAIGKTTIGATCDAISATTTIEVIPERVVAVVVTPATLTLDERTSGQLSVRANDARGKAIGGRQVLLRSADPSIATVAPDGIVTAKSIGRTRIDATIEGQTATAEIVVRPAAVTSVTVTPQAPSVFAGDLVTFAATLRDATGHVVSARSARWSSSDAAVVQVDDAGRATAKKAGTADVTAECDGVRATARVTVAAAPIVRLDVVAPATSLRTGKRLRLSAKAQDKTGRELVPDNVAWRSSNPAVATVAADGTVTAVAPGEVTCFGVVGAHEGRAILTVTPVPARRPVPIAVPIGGAVLVAAVIVAVLITRGGDDGDVRQPTPAVTPQPPAANPSAPGPVAVNPPTPPAETTATPRQPAPATPAAVASLRVTSRNPLVLEAGQTSRAAVRAATADGDAVSAPGIRWSSADADVATVNANGTVAARREGRTIVTATAGGASARIEVVVNRAAPASVAIAPRTTSIRVGEQTTLTARIRDRVGATLATPALWRSSNSSVATVDNSGTVNGVRPGDVTVSASAGSASDSVRVTVTQAVAVVPPVRDQPAPPTPRPPEETRPPASGGSTASAAEVDAALVAAARTIGERFARGQLGAVTATGPFSKFVREDQPQLVGTPQVQRRNVADSRAEGDVSMPLRWRTFTGAVRNGSVVLRIMLEHQAGTWRPTSARNLNVP